MARPILTFTSDFGLEDWFVGVVHGVLYQTCPDAHIVDLCHSIDPGDIDRAAFILEASAPDFPPGTIHLAVVDPGVGTERRALAVRAHGQYFVGPDNGLLEWAFNDPAAVIHQLTDESYFRRPVSRTFHGRDVFAPVAAHLGCGVALGTFGPAAADPIRLQRPPRRKLDGQLEGRVMFIDRFGNALSNLTHEDLERAFDSVPESRLEATIGARHIQGVTRSYGDAPIGTLVAIIGSSGRLEIAQVGGHAALRFGFGAGDRVTVRVAAP